MHIMHLWLPSHLFLDQVQEKRVEQSVKDAFNDQVPV